MITIHVLNLETNNIVKLYYCKNNELINSLVYLRNIYSGKYSFLTDVISYDKEENNHNDSNRFDCCANCTCQRIREFLYNFGDNPEKSKGFQPEDKH